MVQFFLLIVVLLTSARVWGNEGAYYRDNQILYDLDRFSFNQVIAAADQAWAVIAIKPGQFSGSMIQGRFNPRSGKAEMLADGDKMVWVEEAICKVRAWLTGKPADLEYDVLREFQPDFYQREKVGSAVRYSAFRQGGVVIACVNLNHQNTNPAKFHPVYLIPPDWEAAVKPALDFFHENQELFEVKDATINRVRLAALLGGDNPLLASIACRVLAKASVLNHDQFVEVDLLKARGIRQAVFVRYALLNSVATQRSGIIQKLHQLTTSAVSKEELRPLALGIAYFASEAEAGETKQACLSLLGHLQAKHGQLSTTAKSDPYVLAALQAASYWFTSSPY